MRVLIVGSSSMIGRHIGGLLSREHSVYYAGRKNADFFLDLERQEDHFPAGQEFDAVIHCAADFGGEREDDFFRSEIINAIGGLTVASISRKVGAKLLVLLSSSSAYYSPGHPFFNTYALSKRHGDELVSLYSQKFGLALTVLRPTQVYGTDDGYRIHQPLFYHIIDRAAQGKDVVLYGGNDAVRNYLHIDDLAGVVKRVLQRRVVGTFPVSSQRDWALSEVAKTAFDVFGTQGKVVFDTTKADVSSLPAPDSASFYDKIDMIETVELHHGIERIKMARSAR
ncbi:NAD-dependent epimerase/dehydratase family protein [Neorhizobium galegae]|uniref:NAD-dependent epimerase/dehydratase family protein n=1 Tax=Neorhizobium galegae TaxID=399 RepID=UPI000622AA29|nr:NAD(P)-dependent oxidoreductase [Neorhizobium galegae]KAB1121165.1 NAD(P)-dependent oxidoreductase [Neorhizobium galegae]MCQ1807427.1 NAD(P)-dependent oxidoreductase [Neorhizobium galegae]CDZ61598.1 GDP-L-fucose synthetase [Neorhizobium galegae bv. orientalis]